MAVPGFNGIVDISHHNEVASFETLREGGIRAVIHKATEGAAFRDKRYRERRDAARRAGLLWGAYHYASGAPVATQVSNFLAHADPRPDELIALDYEASSSGPDMSLQGMIDFVGLIGQRLGRRPVIYGGHLLRLVTAGRNVPELSACPLWFSRYAPSPRDLPSPWNDWTFWQYTDGRNGPAPHLARGIGRCDRDTFNGSEAELLARWPFG